jgi:electron transport complex protein RnfG
MKVLGRSITRNSLLLAAFAVATALLVSGTFVQTRDRIALEQRKAEEKALLQIVPRSRHDNSMLDDTLPAPLEDDYLRLNTARPIYVARAGGSAVAVVLPARAPDGYSGDIELAVGVNRDGSVAGVRVLNHRETPGLGDKIDRNKSDWVEAFKGRSLDDPAPEQWAVRKDRGVFDQFTGATITPRAVVAATRRALEYAALNHGQLFGEPEVPAGSTAEPPASAASATPASGPGAPP